MAFTLQEKQKNLDKLAEGFNKKAGKTMLGRISKSEDLRNELKTEWIPVASLNVNEITGGGIPKGKISIISGNPDSGKTMFLLETIGLEMKRDPNFMAGWLESEGSITQDNLDQFGIDPTRFFYQRFDKANGAEKAIDGVEAALLTGVDMYVINSLKCLVPAEELNKDMGSMQIGLQARMNGKMMRKLKPLVTENKVAFTMVQHLSTEIGKMYGDPLQMSGGLAIRYAADLILDLRKRSMAPDEPVSKTEGVKIGVSVMKNHVVTNRFPYLKTEYYGIFGQGTEIYLEAIELASQQGLIVKAGAFIKVPDKDGNPIVLESGEKMQWQGISKFRQYCIDNPVFFDDLRSKIEASVEIMSEEEVNSAKSAEKETEEIISEANTIEEFNPMEDVLEEAKKASKTTKNKSKK